jgi:hypothetical protein
MECLPDSTLPDELRNAVYDVGDLGDGERILATAITDQFTLTADGEFEPLTQGSTKPISSTVTRALGYHGESPMIGKEYFVRQAVILFGAGHGN